MATSNRYGILTHSLLEEDEPEQSGQTSTTTGTHAAPTEVPDQVKIKPPPVYIHGKIDHAKLLETVREKFDNKFHAKFSSGKLKIVFQNLGDFLSFKEICQNDKIQYHTYSIPTEKVLIVVLKELIKLPSKTIINELKTQGLKPLTCAEIPAPTKYPIYRISFAPGTTLAKVNHTRYVHNIKIYWEKFESKRPTIQCYRCQTHGHTSNNCNKKAVCVKCAGQHDSRECSKKPETPPICANCGGEHPANYSKCPALQAFLTKKASYQQQHQILTYRQTIPSPQAFPVLQAKQYQNPAPTIHKSTESRHLNPHISYANITSRATHPISISRTAENNAMKGIEEVKTADLDTFFKIISLIKKYYVNCTNNLDRVQAAIIIVKELDNAS